MSVAAAFATWLGASLIVLSDGRRGLALGLALTTIGFTVLVWIGGEQVAAGAVLLGGAVASIQRLRRGHEGWVVMPPGSTSRLVLAIGAGLLALWIATSVMTGPGATLRFAVLTSLAMMGVRALSDIQPAAMLTVVAALALSVAVASGMADTGPGPSPYFAAALIALGVSAVRVSGSDGA